MLTILQSNKLQLHENLVIELSEATFIINIINKCLYQYYHGLLHLPCISKMEDRSIWLFSQNMAPNRFIAALWSKLSE